MYHKPKVSVIIPCYNSEKHLQKAVDSVLQQSLESFEIILVDDGSTDKTPYLLQQLKMSDLRIDVITHAKNMGLGPARNSGIEQAGGEYIFFLDSDDYIHPNTFEVFYELASSQNLDILQGRYVIHENNNKELYPKNLIPFPDAISGLQYYHQGIFIEPKAHGKLWKTEFIKENNFKFPTGYYEDIVLVFNAFFQAKRVNNSLFPAYRYIIRNDSITGQKITAKHVLDYQTALKNLQSLFIQESLIDKNSSFPASFLLYMVELCRMSYELDDKEIHREIEAFTNELLKRYRKIMYANKNISKIKRLAMIQNPCRYARLKIFKNKIF